MSAAVKTARTPICPHVFLTCPRQYFTLKPTVSRPFHVIKRARSSSRSPPDVLATAESSTMFKCTALVIVSEDRQTFPNILRVNSGMTHVSPVLGGSGCIIVPSHISTTIPSSRSIMIGNPLLLESLCADRNENREEDEDVHLLTSAEEAK